MNNFRSHLPDGFDLPKRISRLGELAYNLWWTWKPDAKRALRRLDADLWERLGHNPIRFLHEIGRRRLNQAAKNEIDGIFSRSCRLKTQPEIFNGLRRSQVSGPVSCCDQCISFPLPLIRGCIYRSPIGKCTM